MRRRGETGSALIEAAFVLPALALLICGSVDIARALSLTQIAATAARAGAHRALEADPHSVDLSAIESAATADAAMRGFTARASRACSCGPESRAESCDVVRCASRASYIRVETSAEMKLFIRYLGVASPF